MYLFYGPEEPADGHEYWPHLYSSKYTNMKKQTKSSSRPRTKVSETEQSQPKNEAFPGYPLYPSNEDIMTRGERIDLDLDNGPENAGKSTEANQFKDIKDLGKNQVENLRTNKKQPSDLTKDDFQALASDEIESAGDDEILTNRVWPVDFSGDDLDIPGSEQDDAQERVGSEDEENNSYSLGSDRHADLDEDHS
jgi:hypothetical protein